jgi:hypothetical protein
MSSLQSFVSQHPVNKLTFFSDFIGDSKPWGYTNVSNALGSILPVFSNTNADGCLGTVTGTHSAATAASGFQRLGIYLNKDTTGIMERLWSIAKGTHSFESRIKSTVAAADPAVMSCNLVVGFHIYHANNTFQNGACFFHTNQHTTWQIAIWVNYVNMVSIDTGYSVSQFRVLRVESQLEATRFNFYVDGKFVYKWVGNGIKDDIATSFGHPMPGIEFKDLTVGGSGVANSFCSDYVFLESITPRT